MHYETEHIDIRIPFAFLKEIVEDSNKNPQKNKWEHLSFKGNRLVAKKSDGVNSIDFTYNPGD